jgi:hypothetical protein
MPELAKALDTDRLQTNIHAKDLLSIITPLRLDVCKFYRVFGDSIPIAQKRPYIKTLYRVVVKQFCRVAIAIARIGYWSLFLETLYKSTVS